MPVRTVSCEEGAPKKVHDTRWWARVVRSSSTLSDASKQALVDEIPKNVGIIWPVLISYILQQVAGLVSLAFIGRFGSDFLAAAGLSVMFVNVTGLSVAQGLCSALDTMCGQAYGANKPQLVGIYLQRMIFITTVATGFIFLLWSFAEDLLLALGQDPRVAELSQEYIFAIMPGFWPVIMFECVKRYLAAQRIVRITIVCGVVQNVVNILCLWLFIDELDWGFVGAPYALSVSNTAMFITILFGTFIMKYHKETWPGWSLQMFRDLWPIFSLGLAGAAMLCAEWWSFEVLALLAGLLGTDELAAYTVTLNIAYICYMFPLSVSVAVSTRISNNLGAGRPHAAKVVAVMGVCIGVFTSLSMATIVSTLRDPIARIFTSDSAVLKLTSAMFLVTALFQIFDTHNGVIAGIVRGVGLQRYAAIVNLGGFYLIGIPLALSLAFSWGVGLGGVGLWWGLTISLVAQTIGYWILLSRTDWEHHAKLAQERASKEDQDYHAAAEYSESRSKSDILISKMSGSTFDVAPPNEREQSKSVSENLDTVVVRSDQNRLSFNISSPNRVRSSSRISQKSPLSGSHRPSLSNAELRASLLESSNISQG